MKTTTETKTMILVTWHDYSRQIFPRTLETLDHLVAQADGYESIEEVEFVSFKADGEAEGDDYDDDDSQHSARAMADERWAAKQAASVADEVTA